MTLRDEKLTETKWTKQSVGRYTPKTNVLGRLRPKCSKTFDKMSWVRDDVKYDYLPKHRHQLIAN